MNPRTDTAGALEFFRLEIHRRIAVLDTSDARGDTGLEKHDFRQGGFSRATVAHEGNISNLIGINSHLRSSLTRSRCDLINFNNALFRGLSPRMQARIDNAK